MIYECSDNRASAKIIGTVNNQRPSRLYSRNSRQTHMPTNQCNVDTKTLGDATKRTSGRGSQKVSNGPDLKSIT
jgi:hypothetical protein